MVWRCTACNPDRCFSIVSSARTLDLEAISDAERGTKPLPFTAAAALTHPSSFSSPRSFPVLCTGVWVITFLFLMEYSKRRYGGVPCDSKAVGTGTAPSTPAAHATAPPLPHASSVPGAAGLHVSVDGTGSGPSSPSNVLSKMLENATMAENGVGSAAGPSASEAKLTADLRLVSKRLREATAQSARLQRMVDKFEEENRYFYIANTQFKIDVQVHTTPPLPGHAAHAAAHDAAQRSRQWA
jgi:hypothetical protein